MSKKQHPSTINIFLADGDPDGLRIIGKSHWTGKGIVFTRSGYKDASKRKEFQKTGVYVLVGETEDSSLPLIYIGEGEPVKRRIDSHFSNKDFWSWGIFFVSSDNSLNKAHVKNLESRLITLAEDTKRAKLDNSKGSEAPTLTEWEKADVDSFLTDMLNIFPLIGLNAFKKPLRKKSKKEYPHLTLAKKGIIATGQDTPEGFIVFKGSEVYGELVDSAKGTWIEGLFKDLVETGVIAESEKGFHFTMDYTFKSPTAAAVVIIGRNTSGPQGWKSKEGKSLKKLQEEQVTDTAEE